ncbi:TetR family transcriptional regulator [Brevibacillus laterosporus]|uniref:TetR/AcrR family transcriptional regulator n=1 Tax=Brevibacillus laterosporus TaxID=1465 RepID=A0AAP8QBC6_BRELA|nr:TetR family transcriptional regulator [Brevibacillus laterosporus]ATO50027.1 TetR family transcriptional regulator [Brevibacillus laterosporus DSM 25]AYB39774.1 TetR/AcrR family transcriptional regulator [Brevibacillus laterosporus]MBG9775797.1 TetR family transcriptional regulator [Brevibacillus laterosporus]MBG9799359.1 TetR family transcriptional regulator [Brevibacillus laterosporus]MBG9803033.1 TetR family transcriptional regulator [Brevibacillus laterosporus]
MASISDGKYNKILEAAIDVISEKGLDKTSISDIVKKAGIAQGTFYLYFSSKKALIPAIADNLLTTTLERIKEKIQGKENFWDALEIVIDETFNITDSYKEIIVLCYSGLAIDYSMEKWEAIYRPYYHWFEVILNKAINDNEIINDINVERMAKMIINLVENAAERFYIGRDQDDTVDIVKAETYSFIKRSLLKK